MRNIYNKPLSFLNNNSLEKGNSGVILRHTRRRSPSHENLQGVYDVKEWSKTTVKWQTAGKEEEETEAAEVVEVEEAN